MYDFTTQPDRRAAGSSKWDAMLARKPSVGLDIVPLSVADMELPQANEIVSGLKSYLEKNVLGYARPTPAYIQSVVNWFTKRHNFLMQKDWIVNAQGVVPALYNAVRAFTEEGEGVIIQPPVYHPFFAAIESARRRIVKNPLLLDEKTRRYTMNFAGLEKLARDPAVTLMILCSPHNPVGRVWTKTELETVHNICKKSGVLVISDEIHCDIVMKGHQHTVFAGISDAAAENCIVCTAASKTFNLAGLQASNIIIKNEKLRAAFKKNMSKIGLDNINCLGLEATRIAYTECEAWLDGFLSLLEAQHGIVKRFFEQKLPKIKAFDMEGTYLQWLDFRALGKTGAELENFLVDKADWFANDGRVFGEEGALFQRINLACPSATLEAALGRLEAALRLRQY